MSSGNSRHELVKRIQKLPISAEEKMKQIRQLFQTEVTVEKKGIKCTHYVRKCELLSPSIISSGICINRFIFFVGIFILTN